MPRPQYALKTFIQRVLILRLIAGGALFAAGFGVLAYARGHDRIADVVVLTARYGIERIRVETKRLIDLAGTDLGSALQQALEAQSAEPLDRRYGEFVLARFVGTDGSQLAERVRPRDVDAALLRDAMGGAAIPLANRDEAAQRNVDVAGHPHVHIVVPVRDRGGTLVVRAEGLFRVSEEALAQVRRTALQNAGYVALIVFATSLLLYPVIVTLMRRLAQYSQSLLASNLESLEALGSAIAKRDSDTDAHNYRVTLYSLELAEAVGLDAVRLQALVKGAFLHDVGKIGIPDRILHKPARLDAEEFAIMRSHVDQGLDIVRRIRWLEDARCVVGGHHEKFDGSGYPARLAGGAIAIEARIFAIADVFDALTSRRPYKEPLSLAVALEILEQGRGAHFDPMLLDRFAAIAPSLYARYGGRDDGALRAETRAAVNRLFAAGLDTLRY